MSHGSLENWPIYLVARWPRGWESRFESNPENYCALVHVTCVQILHLRRRGGRNGGYIFRELLLFGLVFREIIDIRDGKDRALDMMYRRALVLGAIFTHDQKDSSTELAFKYAVYKINKERLILPKTTLEYDIQYVPKDDSFHASKKACQQVKYGVQAVFGPSDPILGQHIHSICDALDIPHLEARLDLDTEAKEFSINLYPAQSLLNAAYQDIMEFLNWTKVAIIYEDDYGLVKLRELVRSPKSQEMEVNLRQADPDSYRQVLSEMKSKEIRNLIVDTRPEHMHHFLRMILQLQMNDYKYHYLFTTFDIETFDLEDFKYNFVNITAFRLVDAEDVGVRGILRDMERYQPSGNTILNKSRVIQAEPALMYDSVQVFAIGLRTLEQSHALRPANISCEMEHPWDGGLSLINYINSLDLTSILGQNARSYLSLKSNLDPTCTPKTGTKIVH
ncbi:Glutamate receptor, ionotropic kainate [Apis cerana cerana]|uniref:Glutamate receptor, ionotropic kainate n=1 Tax=Apis cerana cerana TaxID=94128 RepID=A0A2A3EPR2_APICC|nr:Glutamate receptor, ionotropic kainate [Apis cerana cerana]